jgi:hypothetical protein
MKTPCIFWKGVFAVFTSLQALARDLPEPPPTRQLAVCYLFSQELPELYFKDVEENPQSLRIERERFTTWNIIPAETRLPLYRKGQDAEGEEIYEQVTVWELPPGDEPVRRLFYLQANRTLGTFDLADPPGKHLPLSIRAINLTDEPVAMTLDDRTETLPPYAEKLFSAPSDTNVRFKFQYGAKDTHGRVRVSPVSNLRFRSERQRMTLIFGLQPEYDVRRETREFTGFSVRAMRIYDVLGTDAP